MKSKKTNKQKNQVSKKVGTPVATNKKRQKFSFSDETMKKLEWLVQEHKKRSKKRIYPCDTLSEMIDNEYVIRKSFRN